MRRLPCKPSWPPACHFFRGAGATAGADFCLRRQCHTGQCGASHSAAQLIGRPSWIQLASLIAAGDYAAVEALEPLDRQLSDPAARGIFQDIQQFTEDLETEAALQALQRLQTLLCTPGLPRD